MPLAGNDLKQPLADLPDSDDQAQANLDFGGVLLDWLTSGTFAPASAGAFIPGGGPGATPFQAQINLIDSAAQNGAVQIAAAFAAFWATPGIAPPATAVTPPPGIGGLAALLAALPATDDKDAGIVAFINALVTGNTGAIAVPPSPAPPGTLVITPATP